MFLHLRFLSISVTLIALSSLKAAEPPIELIAVENSVESSIDGQTWTAAQTGDRLNYGTHVRTGEFSRAALRYPTGNVIRLSEFSNMRIAQPDADKGSDSASTHLREGALHFFSRYRDAESDVQTPAVNAAIRGTEFEIRILEDGSTELSLFEGSVVLNNASGSLELASGERGRAEPNSAPVRVPMIDASRHIQWYLYYPAILDPVPLDLSAPDLQPSLEAYRNGDLLAALESLPPTTPDSGDVGLYKAQLTLASGQIYVAAALVQGSIAPEAAAIRELIATVRGSNTVPQRVPETATGWLARSYTLQAAGDLNGALEAALRATELAPDLGYAWSRVARLQFSMGAIAKMNESLARASQLSPRNGESAVLRGFERAANNDWSEAERSFLNAIEMAPAYADAWLGLGLIRFKQENESDALKALLAAAALEPNRSILRSYLGKGFAETQRDELALQAKPSVEKALHELTRAQELDPADPTPWLYAALLKQDANRPIEAIHDLRESIRLNDNRSLFRSRLLLDEDLAVRRSNLAEIYRQAGLPTQALSEAGKAVTDDYLNFSAHDFIGGAYRSRLDPTGLAQRFDTVVSNAWFLRNILAPIGAGLSVQDISNQEYTSLFNQQGLSGSASALYDSRERHRLSGFGTYTGESIALAVETLHQDWSTQHFNDDYDQTGVLAQFKFEPTAVDRFYATVLYNESEQGDVRQITNPDATARAIRDYSIDGSGRTIFSPVASGNREIDPIFGRDPELRIRNWQEPLVFASYRREWNPENSSLILLGHTDLRTEINDPLTPVTSVNTSGATPTLRNYESSFFSEQAFDLQSFELQHIYKDEANQLILGARYQSGKVKDRTEALAAIPSTIAGNAFLVDLLIPDAIDSAGSGRSEHDFDRWSAYGYYTRHLNDAFSLIAAASVEGIDFADGLFSNPRTSDRKDEELFAPKLGFVWQLNPEWVLRGAWSRSLSGYSIEDQLRLEPTQVAGLATTYRSILPTTVTGTMAGGTNDVFTLNFSGALTKNTFATIEAFHGQFSGDRAFGLYEESIPLATFPNDPGEVTIGSYRQELDYEEYSLLTRVDHLLTDRVSIGASAQIQYVTVDESTNSPLTATNPLLNDSESTLYIGSLYGSYLLPEGWFVSGAFEYWIQDNTELSVALDDAELPILNLSLGRRLQNQRGSLTVNVLNLTEEDDGLNSLNYFIAPPDERVVTVELKLNF